MWIDQTTQHVFKYHQEIRDAFPNTSFPSVMTDEVLASVGVVPVIQMTPPAFDRRYQKVVENAPAMVNGAWEQQWSVVPLSATEQQDVAAQIQKEIVDATQQRLDVFVKTRNYDGILSACTYASSTVLKFRTEGQYCVDARDNTWATLYSILAEVQAGTRPMPSGYAEIELLLPTLTWPA